MARLRPGTRLQLRGCQDGPDQIFEWNVDTFEIKFYELCLDAFRVGGSLYNTIEQTVCKLLNANS